MSNLGVEIGFDTLAGMAIDVLGEQTRRKGPPIVPYSDDQMRLSRGIED